MVPLLKNAKIKKKLIFKNPQLKDIGRKCYLKAAQNNLLFSCAAFFGQVRMNNPLKKIVFLPNVFSYFYLSLSYPDLLLLILYLTVGLNHY